MRRKCKWSSEKNTCERRNLYACPDMAICKCSCEPKTIPQNHCSIAERRIQAERKLTDRCRIFWNYQSIEGCEVDLKMEIFEWLDVKNKHSSFQNPLWRRNYTTSDANNEDQDFQDSCIISYNDGV